MIRHIVVWNFNADIDDKSEVIEKFKADLNNLKKYLDGIIELNVYVKKLGSCDRDIVLSSLFKDEQSLNIYMTHPKHVEIIDFTLKNFTDRLVFDYIEN